MTSLVIPWIDNGIMIIVALLLLRFYFKPDAKRLYKKKWVLLICVGLIVYSVAEILWANQKYFRFRIPTLTEVNETMQADGVVLSSDQIFSSQDGYQILVPTGYQRVGMKSGAVSLVAVKEGASMIVAIQPSSDSLDKTVAGLKREFKSRYKDSSFLGQQNKIVASDDMVVLEHEMTRNNMRVHLTTVMIKHGNKIFQLMLSSKKDSYVTLRPEFEKIIQSFTLK